MWHVAHFRATGFSFWAIDPVSKVHNFLLRQGRGTGGGKRTRTDGRSSRRSDGSEEERSGETGLLPPTCESLLPGQIQKGFLIFSCATQSCVSVSARIVSSSAYHAVVAHQCMRPVTCDSTLLMFVLTWHRGNLNRSRARLSLWSKDSTTANSHSFNPHHVLTDTAFFFLRASALLRSTCQKTIEPSCRNVCSLS